MYYCMKYRREGGVHCIGLGRKQCSDCIKMVEINSIGEAELKKLQAFARMCKEHDLTYQTADSAEEWRKGVRSFEEIRQAAKSLNSEYVEIIWNRVVREKIRPGNRLLFFWKEEWND